MEVTDSLTVLQKQCLAWRSEGKSIALVPTMGYFHDGHESLMREGRKAADKLVVTLFVNPTQFAPGEDLDAYPRDVERDKSIARSHGTDLLFCPTPEAMYHPDHATWVEVPTLGALLCGQSRPTHFRGVTTVVAKLFHLAQPTSAFFGQKDRQQLAIIKRMVRDLNFPVSVVGVPISREPDGLARSSRNAYLTPEERAQAPHLQKGLLAGKRLAEAGEQSPQAVKAAVLDYWQRCFPLGVCDYLEIVHPESLAALSVCKPPMLLAAAVKVGRARLIDNICIE